MNDMKTDDNQIPEISSAEVVRLRWLLMLASLLFIPGIFMPMITISKFVIVRNSFSVISGVLELLHNGQIILFIVVTGFSIVLPIMKILILFKILLKINHENSRLKRYLHLMHEYGRWGMLDVLIVAVLIVTVKLGVIASVKVHSGLYVFGASILLIMFITNRVSKFKVT